MDKNIERKVLSLTKKFISIKSVPGNPQELEKILGLALSNLKGYTIERFKQNGVNSALIYNSRKRSKKFKIILNGHLDVVPGKEYQYLPKIKGNRLYGVGSMDMKANAACLIMVFKEVADKTGYPLGLQLVTDEEVGGFNGTKYQIEKGVRADFVIAGEPTNFDIVNKAKGILRVKIIVSGQAAHGAYPWRGENAIWRMNKFLCILKKNYPIPIREKWATTVNLSRIETTNLALNKIPDDCTVELDIRFIPEDSKMIVADIKKLIPNRFKLEIMANEPALQVDPGNDYIKTLRQVGQQVIRKSIVLRGAHGSSDARHFTRVNCPGVEFGPVGGGIGSDGEWVDISSLAKYGQILKRFLLSFN